MWPEAYIKSSHSKEARRRTFKTIAEGRTVLRFVVGTETPKRWKEWVSRYAGVSKNWLTRAVKKGELVVPIKSHS
jgi:hypothetical protein